MEKSDVTNLAANAYYVNAKMIKFLLVENLALKTLLHNKGLITPEEYKDYQKQASEILTMKEQQQMLEHLKSIMESSKAN